jgi:serine/threonine-protein kinase HipA
LRQWQKFAREVRVDADKLVIDLRAMASKLPDAINDAQKRARKEGLDHAIIDSLTVRLTKWIEACGISLLMSQK